MSFLNLTSWRNPMTIFQILKADHKKVSEPLKKTEKTSEEKISQLTQMVKDMLVWKKRAKMGSVKIAA